MMAYSFMLAPGYEDFSNEFNLPYNDINGQLGWGYFIVGLVAFVTNGLAVKFGKRPVFLGGNLIVLASSIWAIYAQSWNMFLASQLVGSVGTAPYSTLVSATIADLYFVHQRALRLAIWVLAISISAAIAGVISGVLIENYGWPMIFKTCMSIEIMLISFCRFGT